jgi:hypothetical protein
MKYAIKNTEGGKRGYLSGQCAILYCGKIIPLVVAWALGEGHLMRQQQRQRQRQPGAGTEAETGTGTPLSQLNQSVSSCVLIIDQLVVISLRQPSLIEQYAFMLSYSFSRIEQLKTIHLTT